MAPVRTTVYLSEDQEAALKELARLLGCLFKRGRSPKREGSLSVLVQDLADAFLRDKEGTEGALQDILNIRLSPGPGQGYETPAVKLVDLPIELGEGVVEEMNTPFGGVYVAAGLIDPECLRPGMTVADVGAILLGVPGELLRGSDAPNTDETTQSDHNG